MVLLINSFIDITLSFFCHDSPTSRLMYWVTVTKCVIDADMIQFADNLQFQHIEKEKHRKENRCRQGKVCLDLFG